jgi:hypothetical protein
LGESPLFRPKCPRTLDHSRPPFFQAEERADFLAYAFFAALAAERAFFLVMDDFFVAFRVDFLVIMKSA